MPKLKNSPDNSINSLAGYFGALIIIGGTAMMLTFDDISTRLIGSNQHMQSLLLLLLLTFLIMLFCEFLQRSTHTNKQLFGESLQSLSASKQHLIRSTLLRFIVLIVPWLLLNALIQHHVYFQGAQFNFTRFFLDYFLWGVTITGLPYIYLTLRYRGGRKFEFNDYAILSLILCKKIYYRLTQKTLPTQTIWQNRRLKKLILVYAVIFFFLPLMLRFLDSEMTALMHAWDSLMHADFSQYRFFQKFHAIYLFSFHFIFVIDVSIAIIAYAVANRWLNNRVKSVDSTMSGWIVALICYPPLNSIFFDQFLAYNRVSTHGIISSEVLQILLMTLVLLLFSIYVWATIALGFKFSNLCNRGIVCHGPYRFMRHPAYTCKNLAWWLDNTHVFSNIWACIALLLSNGIYILRGLTEEKHLKQDSAYRDYCNRVKGRFIPLRFIATKN